MADSIDRRDFFHFPVRERHQLADVDVLETLERHVADEADLHEQKQEVAESA